MRAEDHIAEGPTLLSASGEPVPPQPERLAEGARAGDYVIEGLLGGGAMGDVYAGRHPLIGKRVAVKVIKRHLASAPDAIERFLREARAVNQVGHPNVVDVFAVGRLEDGRLYLVMDLLEGEPLGARLRRGAMPVDQALDILDAIAAALDAAHARGVIHRDLKPDNVFLAERAGDDKPAVFVLDFGIAKLLSTGDGAVRPGTLTDQGTWLGTPAYMAPEQWGADGAGPASDRYALGVIAFEMLAGRAPFQAGSLPAMMEKHFRAPVPSLATGEGVALPAAVDGVLGRALAKDPDLRFASAKAMVAELRAALGTTAGRAPATARARGARRPVPRLAIALGAATAVAGIATAALVLRGGGNRSEGAAPPAPAIRGERVEIGSTPSGARVRVAGVDRGVTPLALDRDELGAGDATVVIDKPGYLATARTLPAGEAARLDVVLQPVDQFEGVWALPDGTLRAFERRGEQVAMFSLESGTSEKNFERFFEFVAADAGQVRFVAAEEHVDGRAPDEPSCHVGLRAEYVYELDQDHLARRMERVQLDYAEGRCALRAKEWGDAAALRRLATAEDAGWVESRAGSGNPEKALVPQVPFPGDQVDEKQKKAPPRKERKAPAKKPASKEPPPFDKEQANAPPPEAQNQAARGTTEKTPVGVDVKKRPQKTRPGDGASQQLPPPTETQQRQKD